MGELEEEIRHYLRGFTIVCHHYLNGFPWLKERGYLCCSLSKMEIDNKEREFELFK